MADSSRISALEPLRGLAAFAVMWFHFTAANSNFPPGLLKSSGQFGNLGVTVFFVISGIVIPYSLWRGGYRLSQDGFVFAAKRTVRLHPPYLLSLSIIIVLAYLSALAPNFRGSAPHFDPCALPVQFFYLSGIVGEPWLNGVAWTLAIECQWYLLAAILHPLFTTRRFRYTAPLALAGCSLLLSDENAPRNIWIIQWLPVFSLGVIGFQLRADLIAVRWAWITGLIAAAICYWSTGALYAIAACATVLAVLYLRLPATGALGFLGTVSYSLYLLHAPIGGRVINLGTRFASSTLSLIAVLMAAVIVSLIVAWLLYWFVEKPAAQWSSRLKYGVRRSADPVVATVGLGNR